MKSNGDLNFSPVPLQGTPSPLFSRAVGEFSHTRQEELLKVLFEMEGKLKEAKSEVSGDEEEHSPSSLDARSRAEESVNLNLKPVAEPHKKKLAGLRSAYDPKPRDSKQFLDSILSKIGESLRNSSTIEFNDPLDISSRGSTRDMLGPVELQSKMISYHIPLSLKEIDCIMKRFGNASYQGRVDLKEVFSWARLHYDRHHAPEPSSHERQQGSKGSKVLVGLRQVSRAERARLLETEFVNKLNEKLALASVDILRSDKYDVMEAVNPYISVTDFRAILRKLGLFLSHREEAHLENKYSMSSLSDSIVDFLAFKYEMVLLGREAVRQARQDQAVTAFKSSLCRDLSGKKLNALGKL